MIKRLILLPLLLLTSCSASIETANANVEQPTFEFTMQDYENVAIHNGQQAAYLADPNYENVNNYANGTSEQSKPYDFKLEWSFTCSIEERFDCLLFFDTDPNFSSPNIWVVLSDSEPNKYYCNLNNLMIGTKYYYFVSAFHDIKNTFNSDVHTFETADIGPRNIAIDGVTNARDLGGYTNINGKRVKQGLVYRMAQLNKSYELDVQPLNLIGVHVLKDILGIKSEIDLREVRNNESGGLFQSVLGTDVNYFPYPMTWDVTNAAKNETEAIRKVFKVFTKQENYPLLFHCAIGTDRTGVIAFYLGALLGFKDIDLYHDYLFSNFGNIGGPRGIDNINSHFAYLNTFTGNNIQEKAFSYFKSIGFSESELQTICNIMLEE